MPIQKPTIPKGTRDFGPGEMSRRNYIFDVLRRSFRLHGYLPIETPAMENLSTLLGKYGEEGDKLLFRILNSGDFLAKTGLPPFPESSTPAMLSAHLAGKIAEKGLRYDLTVPFARYVVQHRHELTFPFKRYQIQPVWRADRPQKGRYREFFQCDVDVIGSTSLLNEVDLLQIIDEVFSQLNIKIIIRINNRRILAGIAELIGESDHFFALTTALDKMEKIGAEKVREELLTAGIPQQSIDLLQPFLELKGNNAEKIKQLHGQFHNSPIGKKGLEEIETILKYQQETQQFLSLDFDPRLARGLNYYTGAIIEVLARDVKIGSLCGGGRYDNLTGVFGMEGISGVGVSFGADRIYDVLEELSAFPETVESTTKLMFINFGGEEELIALQALKNVHNFGINAEIFPEPINLKKQFSYADSRSIPYVAIVGSEEIKMNSFTLKNLSTGEQKMLRLEEIIEFIMSET